MKEKIYLSIVIPAYKEELVIEKTFFEVERVLKETGYKFEIIFVVDGLVDNTFDILLKKIKKHTNNVKLFGYLLNRGKGYALRVGFNAAQGMIIGFIDADGQIDPNGIKLAVNKLEKSNLDIVVGSKRHEKSRVKYSIFRRFVSAISQIFIKILFNIEVTDTQAGLKVFKKNLIKKVAQRLTIDRFGFDIEILSVAKYLGFERIGEVPIKVKKLKEDDSSLNVLIFMRDLLYTFFESLKVFYNLKFAKYYGDTNNVNWKRVDEPEMVLPKA